MYDELQENLKNNNPFRKALKKKLDETIEIPDYVKSPPKKKGKVLLNFTDDGTHQKRKSNKAIDEFMSWLDCIIEEYTTDDGYNMFEVPSHEHHNREGFIRGLELVEKKAKEFGFIIPPIRGKGL
jgi:hypothetical protein